MTTTDIAGLCERLRAVESSRKFGVTTAVTTNWHRNPDGPEAADTLERQAAEIERLRGALTFAQHQLWKQPVRSDVTLVLSSIDAALTGEDA